MIGKVVGIKVRDHLVGIDRGGSVDLGLKIGAIVILQRSQGGEGIGLQVYHQGLLVIKRTVIEEGQNTARPKVKKIIRAQKRNPVRSQRRSQNQRKIVILKVAVIKVSHVREPSPSPKIGNQNNKIHNH